MRVSLLITLLFLTAFCSNALAQNTANRYLLEYQNSGFLYGNNNGLDSIGDGFCIGYTNIKEQKQSGFDKYEFQKVLDSNSNSLVDYKLGAKQYQVIEFELMRPLSKTGSVEFKFGRAAYPGWIQHNFVRKTDLSFGLQKVFKSRFFIGLTAGYGNLDREQNGGIKDSTYSIKNDSLNHLELVNQIYLTEAYSNRAKARVDLLMNYLIVDQQNWTTISGVRIAGLRDKFRYSDSSPDSTYYSVFSTENFQSVADSSRLSTIKLAPFLSFGGSWANSKIKYRTELSVIQTFGKYNMNAYELGFDNQEVEGGAVIAFVGFNVEWRYRQFVSGYNKGDYLAEGSVDYQIMDNEDSNKSVWSSRISTRIRSQRSHPPVIYTLYDSQIATKTKSLISQTQFSSSISYYLGVGAFSMNITPHYSKRLGFLFFDRNGKVHQSNAAIEVYSTDVAFNFNKPFIDIRAHGKYQWNNRKKVYSLPEWMYDVQVTNNIPLLNNKLTFHPGGRVKYNSAYYARGYIPFYDSFYSQVSKKYDPYFQLDAFSYVTIGQVDIGLEAMNVLYGIFDDDPIIAPNYVSVPRYFLLHIKWKLKN